MSPFPPLTIISTHRSLTIPALFVDVRTDPQQECLDAFTVFCKERSFVVEGKVMDGRRCLILTEQGAKALDLLTQVRLLSLQPEPERESVPATF